MILTNKILANIRKPILNTYLQAFQYRKQALAYPSKYVIRIADPNTDIDKTLHLFYDVYVKEDPTLSYLCPDEIPSQLDDVILKAMSQGFTWIARDIHTEKVVGACINTVTTKKTADYFKRVANQCRCRFKQYLEFRAFLLTFVDLWDRYPVNKVFEISYLFVNPNYRDQGLTLELFKRSRNLGAQKEFCLIRYNSTNTLMDYYPERLNMRLVANMPYAWYLGKNKLPVFKPATPHCSVKVYIDEHPDLFKPIYKKIAP